MLFDREEIIQCNSHFAFDENFEEVKDDVINSNCEGAVDDCSIGLFLVVAPATQFRSYGCVNHTLPNGWKNQLLLGSWIDSLLLNGWRRQILRTFSKNLMKLIQFFNSYQIWIPWVYLTRYPGKCFPGDFVLQIILLFNYSCLGQYYL